ncbi:hypothetical protein [Helicobacter zhangjianzhongii]|uniref:Uncharacterized protein n=1 Tax=Helicobacter zhangjianzhongii TaxID=2974574 RepID=A0ACC6FVP8_9HELI|nr:MULTISPECIES: hypothetical protein [unclassified Helicobacter]MDL0080830.1 hypothetical protein [Helicobacter sp. CPD2-1]MDL0082897.1 hypothetical protein [Helicobacter sp. XJK30-2]
MLLICIGLLLNSHRNFRENPQGSMGFLDSSKDKLARIPTR